jgi:hypothetical protein
MNNVFRNFATNLEVTALQAERVAALLETLLKTGTEDFYIKYGHAPETTEFGCQYELKTVHIAC